MAISIKRNQDNIKCKIVYIGIDMHKLSWRITALVEGEKIWESDKSIWSSKDSLGGSLVGLPY